MPSFPSGLGNILLPLTGQDLVDNLHLIGQEFDDSLHLIGQEQNVVQYFGEDVTELAENFFDVDLLMMSNNSSENT